MGIWNKLFGCKKEEKEQFVENENPDVQIERIIQQMEHISAPISSTGNESGFNVGRELNRLKGRLKDTVKWLRGGADALGNHPMPSGVGYILCQVICGNTVDDPKWVQLMGKSLGAKRWSKLADMLNKIKVIGENLQKRQNVSSTSQLPL
jgi:hypothetical protein